MIYIGLDIGSTTISAVAIDAETHAELEHVTKAHQATLLAEHSWEHLQDPVRLADMGCEIVQSLIARFGEVAGIGLSGQMHGILYTDAQGRAVSPFYTWQDRRAGIVDRDGKNVLEEIAESTSVLVREGYGFATHLWNLRHQCVPKDARWITTISGYVAMRLTHAATPPAFHPSEAASLGLFNLKENMPEYAALQTLGIDVAMIPAVAVDDCLAGYTPEGIPVSCGIGDNQASLLGAVADPDHDILLNIGTGSQITRKLDAYVSQCECEIRPFIDGGYIAVGSGLCGGRAFALLERFVRSCAALAGTDPGPMYERMTALLKDGTETDLHFDTVFCGTRKEPGQRACISNLSPDNFSVADFTRSTLRGIVEELHRYYEEILRLSDTPIRRVCCSGNLVRLTPELLQIVESVFHLPAILAPVEEEAAYGAAMFIAQQIEGVDSVA